MVKSARQCGVVGSAQAKVLRSRRSRRGSVLQSVLALSLVFVVLSAVVFLIAQRIIPGVEASVLARPFLGAFAVWALGVGVAVALTRPRVLSSSVSVPLAEPTQEAAHSDPDLTDRAQHWANLAEYWGLQVRAGGAELIGARGPIQIRCRDTSRLPENDGKTHGNGCVIDIAGIPPAYKLEQITLEAMRHGAETPSIVFDVIRPSARTTITRLLRQNARISGGSISVQLPGFDEDLFDNVVELCEDLGQTQTVSARLVSYYRKHGKTARAALYLQAIFELPVTPLTMQVATEKLRDDDFNLRVAAAAHLGEQGSHVLELIVAHASSPLNIRLNSLAALARQDADRALEVPGARILCLQALRAKDDACVLYAMGALEHIGDRDVVPFLVPLVNANTRFRVAGKRTIEAINSRL